MDVGHSEYWSARAERAFARARERGTSLMFMSSDTMAWRVRFARATAASSQAGEPDHVIVAYKEAARSDPDRAAADGAVSAGRGAARGKRLQRLHHAARAAARAAGLPLLRLDALAALQPAGCSPARASRASTSIPGIVGYELDQRTPASPPGTLVVGAGAACRAWARMSPRRSTAPWRRRRSMRRRSGALVFATGTLGWEYGALARAPGFARRAAGARPAGRGDDAQPARARPRGRG